MNIGNFGRLWRLALGSLLLAWAVAGGPAWGYFGVYLLFAGAFAFSPLRAWLGRQRNSNNLD